MFQIGKQPCLHKYLFIYQWSAGCEQHFYICLVSLSKLVFNQTAFYRTDCYHYHHCDLIVLVRNKQNFPKGLGFFFRFLVWFSEPFVIFFPRLIHPAEQRSAELKRVRGSQTYEALHKNGAGSVKTKPQSHLHAVCFSEFCVPLMRYPNLHFFPVSPADTLQCLPFQRLRNHFVSISQNCSHLCTALLLLWHDQSLRPSGCQDSASEDPGIRPCLGETWFDISKCSNNISPSIKASLIFQSCFKIQNLQIYKKKKKSKFLI